MLIAKMKSLHALPYIFAVLAGWVCAAPAELPRPLSSNDLISQSPLDTASEHAPWKIPTRYESTVLGRRLLALSKTGVLATTFPHELPSSWTPGSVHDAPIGLPDYVASCEEPTGNPTLLALRVSTSTQNAMAGSNVSLSLSWWDEYIKLTHHEPWSAANLPRLSMIGYLEEIPLQEAEETGVVFCFVRTHNDSKFWLPGDESSPHSGLWMRMIVQQIYWIGGFGDRAFIGWFDPEEWHGVSAQEWMDVRLPGEPSPDR